MNPAPVPPSPIHARAATRVDLAGGTLDIWPLFLFHRPAMTVNLAVGLWAEAEARALPGSEVRISSSDRGADARASSVGALDAPPALRLLVEAVRHFLPGGGVDLRTRCAAPAGSGLGGSSALAVATCAVLSRLAGRPLEDQDLLATAMDIETTILGVPTGKQDYFPALHGGVLALHWEIGGARVERLPVDLGRLGSRLVLAFTGEPHDSGVNNWEVYTSRIRRDAGTIRRFDAIAASARAMREALLSEDDERIAAALESEWQMRRELAPGITTARIDSLIRAASGKGCLAAKVCGAGGGGCVVFYASAGSREAVADALRREGALVLDAPPVPRGLLAG